MLDEYVEFGLGVISGILATILTEVLWRPIESLVVRFRKRRNLRAYASRVSIPHLIPLQLVPSSAPSERLDVAQFVQRARDAELQGRLFVIGGDAGTGKTTFARRLLNQFARSQFPRRAWLPLYINGSALRSGRILTEMSDQLKDVDPSISEEDMMTFLGWRRSVLILDALDQAPSTPRDDIAAELLRFLDSGRADGSVQAVIILLVRSEYLVGSSAITSWLAINNPPIYTPSPVTDLQLEAYFTAVKGPAPGMSYVTAYKTLIADRPDADAILRRPVMVSRFANADVRSVHKAAAYGTSVLTNIYRLSFEHLPGDQRAGAQRLAFRLYEDGLFAHSEAGLLNSPMMEPMRHVVAPLISQGILVRRGRLIEFSHATIRDFFVADYFVDEIASGRGEQALCRA